MMELTEGLPWFCAAVFTSAATFTDLKSMRIPNAFTYPAAAAGVALGGVSGWEGVKTAATGLIGAFLMTLLLHIAGAVGAGDVKAFAALGALLGLGETARILAYALVYGAAAGLALTAVRGRLRALAAGVLHSLIGLAVLRNWAIFRVAPGGSVLSFPFMAAVFPAFATVTLQNFG